MKSFLILCVAFLFIAFQINASNAQSHDRIIGTSNNKTEQIYAESVHKENAGIFKYFRHVEAIFSFPTVIHS